MRLAAALLIGLSLPRPCAAQPSFELSWSAPAECPSGAEVSAALARLAPAGSRGEAAHVEIVPVAGRWQATLSTRGAQRRLEGESCAAVVHALTVVLALAAAEAQSATVASVAAPGEPSAAPSPPPVARPSSSEPPAVDRPVAELPRSSSLGWGVRLGLLAELGMLPGPSLGPQAALELHLGRWSVELGGTLLLPRHARLEGEGSPESDIDWLGGQLAACRGVFRALAVCLGAESGRFSGTGSGVDQPLSAAGWWLAGTAGARVRGLFRRGTPLSWQLGLSAAAALARPEFGFDQLGLLHRPSAVSGRLFFGLGWGH